MSRIRLDKQVRTSSNPDSLVITNGSSEVVFLSPSTGADRLVFYDDSGTEITWLTLGTNLSNAADPSIAPD